MASRFDYVRYDQDVQKLHDEAKILVLSVEAFLERLPAGRAKSLALTALEETYMWIGKAIRDEQIARNGSAPLMEERKNG